MATTYTVVPGDNLWNKEPAVSTPVQLDDLRPFDVHRRSVESKLACEVHHDAEMGVGQHGWVGSGQCVDHSRGFSALLVRKAVHWLRRGE